MAIPAAPRIRQTPGRVEDLAVFGRFVLIERAAREGCNPRTNEIGTVLFW